MNNQTSKTLFVLSAAAIIFTTIVFGLGSALVPLMIAFGLAYLTFPIVRALEKRKIKRNYAVLGVFALSTLLFIIFLLLVVPMVLKDAREFFLELPKTSVFAVDTIERIVSNFGYNLDISKQGLKDFIAEHASEISADFLKSSSQFATGLFTNVIGATLAILNLFLIPLFYFYLVHDYEGISTRTRELVPHPWRNKMRSYEGMINTVLSGYVHGQVIVALLMGVMFALGLSLIGLKFGLLIGIFTGLFSIIPYVGSILGFIVAVGIALANFEGFGLLFGIALVFFIVQMLEGFVITPRLVGNKVGLGALTTILALIVGGNLMGFSGMIIAIPAAAILKAVLRDLRTEYFSLPMYKG